MPKKEIFQILRSHMDIIYLIIVGAASGFLASIVIPNGYGLLGTIIVGIIGGVVGGMLLGGQVSIGSPLVSSIITAFLGAIVLLVILKFIKKA